MWRPGSPPRTTARDAASARPAHFRVNDRAEEPLDTVIGDLCAKAGPGRTISPADVAKALAAACADDDWRPHLRAVRRAAVRLALAGKLVIYRKGKPAEPTDFRGIYRLGAPP